MQLAQEERLDLVSNVPGAGDPQAVIGLSVHKGEASRFMHRLPPADKVLFVKAIAVYENTIGGVGSPTLLYRLLQEIEDPDRIALDWILRNTRSYWYYSPYEARSLREYDLGKERQQRYTAERSADIQHRVDSDRLRVVAEATQRLANAVRRGDALAVLALVRRGADVNAAAAPDGRSLFDLARAMQREDIIGALQGRAPESQAGSDIPDQQPGS